MEFEKEYAALYDTLYSNKDYEKECDFIETIFNNNYVNVRKVLDLGCGTGGHALILAKRGYEVEGVDRSTNMLGMAQERAKEANLPIKFINSDITRLNLGRVFDAIIAMFAVMGYQTKNRDFENTITSVKKHLKRGGLFIFDVWHGPAVIIQKPEDRVKIIAKDDYKIIRIAKPILKINEHVVEVNYTLMKIKNNEIINETNESHEMRFFFYQELKYILEKNGFELIQISPFLKGQNTPNETDWNVIVIAKAK